MMLRMSTVGDVFAQVTEGVRHVLELAAVVGDGEAALDEVPEGDIQVESMLITVAKELIFQGELDGASNVAMCPNYLEVTGDGVVKPCQDDAVHACPIWEGVVGGIGQDMAL